jgi:hypothetical protein
MKSKLLIISICFPLLFACNRRPSHLEQALALAGENRAELEKVLAYYSDGPADTLKYRAACFLIENMTGHHEVTPDHTIKPDLKYITSGYMIRNIDVSFRI